MDEANEANSVTIVISGVTGTNRLSIASLIAETLFKNNVAYKIPRQLTQQIARLSFAERQAQLARTSSIVEINMQGKTPV